MLFDLRAPGRKRAVQAVYVILAVVLIGGTILFGVGTNGPGLFSNDNGQSKGTSLSDDNKNRLDALDAKVRKNPKDAAAFAEIARLWVSSGNEKIPESADPNATPPIPDGARKDYLKAADAWNRYTALKPDPVDGQTAQSMSDVFAPTGLNQPGPYSEALSLVAEVKEAQAAKTKQDVDPRVYLQLLSAQYAAKRSERLIGITIRKLRADTTKADRKLVEAQIVLAKDPTNAKATKVLTDAQSAAQGGTAPGGTVTLPDDPSGTTTTAPAPSGGK